MGKEFISDDTKRIFSLPARLGGLGFLDPCSVADLEYESSVSETSQLTNAIYNQQSFLVINEEKQIKTMSSVKHKKNEWYKELQNTIRKESTSSASVSKILDLASEKGAYRVENPHDGTEPYWVNRDLCKADADAAFRARKAAAIKRKLQKEEMVRLQQK